MGFSEFLLLPSQFWSLPPQTLLGFSFLFYIMRMLVLSSSGNSEDEIREQMWKSSVEGFDVNRMTKWKPAIWGPLEAAIYRKCFVC